MADASVSCEFVADRSTARQMWRAMVAIQTRSLVLPWTIAVGVAVSAVMAWLFGLSPWVVVGYAAFWTGFVLFQMWRSCRTAAPAGARFGSAFTDDAVLLRNEVLSTRLSRSSIKKIRVSGDCVMVWTDGKQARVLPRALFPAEELSRLQSEAAARRTKG